MLDYTKIPSRRTRGLLLTVATVAELGLDGWVGLMVWLHQNPLELFDWKKAPSAGFFVLNFMVIHLMVVVNANSPPSGFFDRASLSSHGPMDTSL